MMPMNRFFKVIYFLALFFVVIPAIALAGQYQVIRVIDGNTIVIRDNGKHEKVRRLCVNTPESVHPDKKQNIPMGKMASRYTQKKLTGKYVNLEFEINRLRGNYGRFLAYVFVDGQNLNLDLVRQGLSPYYTKYGKSEKCLGKWFKK